MEEQKSKSYVPAGSTMREFSIKALVIGLVMCVVLGAANAYLGLKAGMTIAATYPAAVIGMALLKVCEGHDPRGELSPEPSARSASRWPPAPSSRSRPSSSPASGRSSATPQHYFEASAIMLVGGILGILFVTILRRVMVEDKDLPFPESVAAAEIHKAGPGRADRRQVPVLGDGPGRGDPGAQVSSRCSPAELGALHPLRRQEDRPRQRRLGRGRRRRAAQHARRQPRLHGRRLHHRAQARGAELHRRPARLGPVRAAAPLLPRAAARRLAGGHRRGPRPRTTPGSAWPTRSGATSCGRSPSAACS